MVNYPYMNLKQPLNALFYLYIIAIEDDFANTGYFNHFLDAVDLASVQFHRLSNITLVYA